MPTKTSKPVQTNTWGDSIQSRIRPDDPHWALAVVRTLYKANALPAEVKAWIDAQS